MQDLSYDDYAVDSPKGVRRWLAVYLKWGGAALSVAVVCLFVVWAYRLGVRDARDIPVIRAAEGPVRVQPDDPGGTEVAHQGLEVNAILGGAEAEAPAETALAPEVLPLAPEDIPPPDLAPAEVAAEPAAEALPGLADIDAGAPDEGGPVLAIDEAVLQALAEAQSGAAPAAEDSLVPDAEAEPGPLAAAPRPLGRPENLAAAAPPVAAAAGAAEAAPLAPGTRLVQLGAFDSPEAAETQWQVLLEGHADLLGDKRLYVQRAESNGRIFFRLRVLGFDDQNAQRAICEALRARSVDCIPVTVR